MTSSTATRAMTTSRARTATTTFTATQATTTSRVRTATTTARAATVPTRWTPVTTTVTSRTRGTTRAMSRTATPTSSHIRWLVPSARGTRGHDAPDGLIPPTEADRGHRVVVWGIVSSSGA